MWIGYKKRLKVRWRTKSRTSSSIPFPSVGLVSESSYGRQSQPMAKRALCLALPI